MTLSTSLEGKRGLVVAIGNGSSIAAGCGRAFIALGAEIAATYVSALAASLVSDAAGGSAAILSRWMPEGM